MDKTPEQNDDDKVSAIKNLYIIKIKNSPKKNYQY